MTELEWAFAEDLPPAAVVAVLLLALLSVVALLWEARRMPRGQWLVVLSGVAATIAFAAAILRPASVDARGTLVGARVLVLVDGSRRLSLPGDGSEPRRDVARRALEAVRQRFSGARLAVYTFGDETILPVGDTPPARVFTDSDLVAALEATHTELTEAPRAVIVISDGRLTRPPAETELGALRRLLLEGQVPIHSITVAQRTPPDAAIRQVRAAGAAVAHQPLALELELGCVGGLRCESLPVLVRELSAEGEATLLASGVADLRTGTARLELSITLDRAGARALEVVLEAPPGDEVPDNNRRFITLEVARDRVRLLHLAGRPTYDVRALRMWLKSDESVDLVAFFILRSDRNETRAEDSELALIPFPVDELFTQHLASFDAVLLQDLDAVEYKLARHLPALARYVERGGGLVMVGGESSFVGGRYAGTELERVLPVSLPALEKPHDPTEFSPAYTQAGREAPMLASVRELHGEELPPMPGANLLGPARPGSIVLLEHPTLRVEGSAMPVLALGEAGDGRAIALGIDGTHRLAFGAAAATAGGRGYGALWDALVGWLMRDPRFEPARITLRGPCYADEPTSLEVARVPGMKGTVELTLEALGPEPEPPRRFQLNEPPTGAVTFELGPLEPGGYVARARVGSAPPMRFDFTCERGGSAWSDVRPDRDRLTQIARATSGRATDLAGIATLPVPAPARVAAERRVTPWFPPWVWSLGAALLLGGHWFARRRVGFP